MNAPVLGRFGLGLLTLGALVVWGYPIAWSVAVTLDLGQPGNGLLDALAQYGEVLLGTRIGRWYLNSFVTSAAVALLTVAISAACGYALSQMRFHGRQVLWWIILASFVVPVQALIVSHFLLMHRWGLLNSWAGVVLPQLVAPLAVIVYRRFFDAAPREYVEAARLDGTSHWRIFSRIFMPLNNGVTASLLIISFIGAWNAFLWPFLAVTRPDIMNLTAGLTEARGELGGVMPAAILAALPVVVLYFLFQRRVTEGVTLSAGIKG